MVKFLREQRGALPHTRLLNVRGMRRTRKQAVDLRKRTSRLRADVPGCAAF